jgi:DNA-binding winged helix-turn-helix (wHTH) protein
MHIVILATTADIAGKMQAALGSMADQYTTVTAWADILSLPKNDWPNLVLVERSVLTRTELSILNSMAEPGRWPPVLLVDAPASDAGAGVVVVQRITQKMPHYYQVGDLHIDTHKRRAKLGERWVTLPPIQYRLLLALAKRAGEVLGCQELLRVVWGYEAEESEARALVKVHIRQIRRRLGLEQETQHYIRSVRGFGYILSPPEED